MTVGAVLRDAALRHHRLSLPLQRVPLPMADKSLPVRLVVFEAIISTGGSRYRLPELHDGPTKYLNPRHIGCLDFPRHAGGGAVVPPPLLTRLLGIVARNRKVCSEYRQKSSQKYFGGFFYNVNIEVIKGHQRSTLAKNPFFRKCAIISETLLVRRQGKKHSIALGLFFRKDAI